MTDALTPERIIDRDESGVTVSYSFPGAVMVEDNLYPGRVRLDIPGFGHNLELEEAAWPIRSDTFEIPEGYEAKVSVVSADWCQLDVLLSPARPLLVDRSSEVYSLDNVPAVKDFVGTQPKSPVAMGGYTDISGSWDSLH